MSEKYIGTGKPNSFRRVSIWRDNFERKGKDKSGFNIENKTDHSFILTMAEIY